ncbi:MAG: DUF2470 domain-containing protein [Candidatus Rokubacteria bacterium]|nr:DUF2470 domain-containing protein [Candidatus Rokubacteria bacterium]
MTEHGRSAGGGRPGPPEPSFAERARTLLHLGRAGTLATLAAARGGHPFASVMPYAEDDGGAPALLLSALAVHTQNLAADPRASLLVTEASASADPLAGGRVTLMGVARRLAGEHTAAVRARYLARHPPAIHWVDFGDFGFWRLEVEAVYLVGGFAAMGWIEPAEYARARPDPLADAAPGIVEHMNRDHAEALVTLARAHVDPGIEEASMLGVDRLGLKVRVRSAAGLASARIPFPQEVATPEVCRSALVGMLQAARAGQGGTGG